jgi:hypothetical protein
MGAFDTYAGEVRCPRCGDVHRVDGQTKFFVPDFFGLYNRHFTPWSPQPLDFSPAELQAPVWDGSWWRVRAPGDPSRFDLLADFSDLFGCDCGMMFAMVLRFRVDAGPPPTATLTAIELRDATTAAALVVDFADGEELLWAGDHAGFAAAISALASAPAGERAARLREALNRRFAPQDEATPGDTPWWCHVGEVRCEACGASGPRRELLLLAHPDHPTSFFGPGWTGGTLTAGMRIAGDFAWLAADCDRGYYTRLRHPVPEDRLTVLGARRRVSCRCGAGPGALVLRFAREPGALVLREATLRDVRGAEDLADVDFAETAYWTRDPSPRALRQCEWTREAALRAVLAGFAGSY